MKTTKKTKVVKDLIKLGINSRNASRIVYESKGIAAKVLVSLIEDLHNRGILVIIS